MRGRGVSRDGVNNFKASIYAANIIIPDNYAGQENRDRFVATCYRRDRVSIVVDSGGVVHDCYITREALREVQFPDITIKEYQDSPSTNRGKSRLGSQVVCMNEAYLDKPVVVGVMSKLDQSTSLQENEYKIVRGQKGNFAVITVTGKTGSIGITTFGNGAGGDLNINVTNTNGDAKLNLGVKGNVNINVVGEVNLSATKNINVSTDESVVFLPKKLSVGEDPEPMLLGNTTQTELNKDNSILTALVGIINGTPIPEPGNGAASALQTALKGAITGKTNADFSKIKSEKSFTE